jgi:hypothetical protein
MKLAATVIHVLLVLFSAVMSRTTIEGINSTKNFDQFAACADQDSIVLRSEADVGANTTDGWFAYSGSLIFCCAGLPYAVTCTEMMLGYCSCPVPTTLTNVSASDFDTSVVCYARTCGSEVLATPILFGKKRFALTAR